MIVLVLWCGLAVAVALIVGRAIRVGTVDQVAEEIGP